MTDYSPVPPAPTRDPYEDTINLWDWARMLGRNRRLIAGTVCAGVLIAAVVAAVTPPPYVAAIRLVVTRNANAALAEYRSSVDNTRVSQQVVDELGLDKAPYGLSAGRFQSHVTASTPDSEGIIVVEVRFGDPTLAAKAANSLARHAVEFARRSRERSRMLEDAGLVLKLKQDVPDLMAVIQGEEIGLRVLEEQLKDATTGSVLQREVALSRVRLAQLRARWDHIQNGLKTASGIEDQLFGLPFTDDLPASVTADYELLDRGFGVSSGRERGADRPLRAIEEARVSGPATSRHWLTYLTVGLALGLLLPLAFVVAIYVLSAGRAENTARATRGEQ